MPDTPFEPNAGAPYPSGLETRVSRLEGDVHEVKATMGRLEMMLTEIKATLDATLPHLATKAELADLRTELKGDAAGLRIELKGEMAQMRGEMGDLRVSLAQMPTKTYMWGILTALLTAYACGLAALAILK
jgi:hypothetical protein